MGNNTLNEIHVTLAWKPISGVYIKITFHAASVLESRESGRHFLWFKVVRKISMYDQNIYLSLSKRNISVVNLPSCWPAIVPRVKMEPHFTVRGEYKRFFYYPVLFLCLSLIYVIKYGTVFKISWSYWPTQLGYSCSVDKIHQREDFLAVLPFFERHQNSTSQILWPLQQKYSWTISQRIYGLWLSIKYFIRDGWGLYERADWI